MCGIAGYMHFERERSADRQTLHRMVSLVAHRGPDGEGIHTEGNVGLAHRRLAIIDLATGAQPMETSAADCVITYNGEIYNYIELRDELERLGHRFVTRSDTEVILEAYRAWGDECVQRFNGMWAFALWDRRRRRLFCSRDRLGEKPFFYAVHDRTFAFASEIKSLFAFGVPKRPEVALLDSYLALTYVPAPYTFFADVHKLPPGHTLVVENDKLTVSRYWDVPLPEPEAMREDTAAICEEFEYLFDDSVRIRMRSDVPVGAFLSGGLDSSSVVSAMARCASMPVRTFTIGFAEPEFDERPLAQLVAERFRTDHNERQVAPQDMAELLEQIAWHYDEPFGDSSALPTMIVSKIAREQVTVAMTGDGGDEVLSGYTIHQGERVSQAFKAVPSILRHDRVPRALDMMARVAPARARGQMGRISRVLRLADRPFLDRLEAKQSGVSLQQRRQLIAPSLDTWPARDVIENALAPVRDRDDYAKLDYWLLKVSLPDDMLCKVDRASMAASLETRVPFLDYRLVELMSRVSMRVKLRGLTRKHVLRASVGRRLPRALLRARKRGFAVPLGAWVRGGQDALIAERARRCAHAGLVDPRALDELTAEHARGRGDVSVALWALAQLSYAL